MHKREYKGNHWKETIRPTINEGNVNLMSTINKLNITKYSSYMFRKFNFLILSLDHLIFLTVILNLLVRG